MITSFAAWREAYETGQLTEAWLQAYKRAEFRFMVSGEFTTNPFVEGRPMVGYFQVPGENMLSRVVLPKDAKADFEPGKNYKAQLVMAKGPGLVARIMVKSKTDEKRIYMAKLDQEDIDRYEEISKKSESK